MTSKERYIAFLRGINVGGHHKVPMADLKIFLDKLGFKNSITLLNSGNVIFDAKSDSIVNIEKTISTKLEQHYGFSIPTIVRKAETITDLFKNNPFQSIELNKDIRLYISFLKEDTSADINIPYSSADESFKIIEKRGKSILSILDLSKTKTPKAMEVLEKTFGKENTTTRNWNTIERIVKKI